MSDLMTEKVAQFISDRETETHTGAEWETLATEAGLSQDEIDQLFDYLDDIH